VLGKRLRLAAAGLTDVGRRRERNQDNTTHHVPTDEAELAKKGALFVVCDGMGGHAAGEVAAEIGVNAIRDTYFASTKTDIIDGLADAIRTANERIFEHASEHPELAGMGTTCVALLIHGGRAYFVNIGDSRAYLARDGKLRQVTLDHSWVAEQVRAGVLTEEQARVHAHRNVITRSLGTQPNVNADLFIEKLREGDRILLCSDGLHGYVEEDAIERTVVRSAQPDESVQALVDMANENGGPDNITAVLVQLLEVPAITDTLALPPEATTGPDGAITQPLPIYSSPRMPAAKRASGALAKAPST
jgi:serine/threonine protein phosphatase PrpC